jgi:hypothetical protein
MNAHARVLFDHAIDARRIAHSYRAEGNLTQFRRLIGDAIWYVRHAKMIGRTI